MALPLILQALGGGLLGQGLFDAYRNRGRSGLLGTMPTPSTMTQIPPVGPPTAQGIMPESEGNVVTPGKPGSGLLGSLYGMNPQVAEQLAPLLQQMPQQDLRTVSRGLVGSIATPPKNDPLSGIAKLQADFAAGRISPDQYEIGLEALKKAGVEINNFPPEFMPDPNNPNRMVPKPGSKVDYTRNKDWGDAIRPMQTLDAALARYEDALNRWGAEMWSEEGKKELESKHTALMIQLKTLYELGALQGPDLEIMEKALPSPTTLGAKASEVLSWAKGGGNPLVQGIKTTRATMMDTIKALEQQYGRNYEGLKLSPEEYLKQQGKL